MVSNTISTLPLPGSSHSAMVRWWRWTPPTRWRQSPVASRGGSNSTPHSCDRPRRAAPLVARCAATPRLLRSRASRHAPTREFALYWIQVSPATGVCCDPATGACNVQSAKPKAHAITYVHAQENSTKNLLVFIVKMEIRLFLGASVLSVNSEVRESRASRGPGGPAAAGGTRQRDSMWPWGADAW